MLDLTKGQFVKHVLFHPFEGFEDLRWKKGGSMKIAVGVLVVLFVEQLVYDNLYGFQYKIVYDKLFNIVPYIFSSFILFITFVVANWAMCTLFDGEGSMKNIFINTAYALIPYISGCLIGTVMSHFLVAEEMIFISAIEIIGTAWTFVLFLSGIKAVHQFSLGKTIALLVLTVVAMIAMLFLLILLLTLFQQVLIFVFSLYTEISYRIRG